MRSAVGIPFLSALKSGSRQAEGGEDVKMTPAKLVVLNLRIPLRNHSQQYTYFHPLYLSRHSLLNLPKE